MHRDHWLRSWLRAFLIIRKLQGTGDKLLHLEEAQNLSSTVSLPIEGLLQAYSGMKSWQRYSCLSMSELHILCRECPRRRSCSLGVRDPCKRNCWISLWLPIYDFYSPERVAKFRQYWWSVCLLQVEVASRPHIFVLLLLHVASLLELVFVEFYGTTYWNVPSSP